MKDLIKDLNPMQQKAVKTISGPVLILAGAGSGKTKALTSRVAYLVSQRKARPEEILAVTFTNKAAEEMRERVKRLLGLRSDRAFIISTFHSLCVRILRREIESLGKRQNFTILDANEQLTAIRQAMNQLNIDIKKYAPAAILSYISSAKSELVEPGEYAQLAQGYFQKLVAKIYPLYQAVLERNNSLDFDDLLSMTVKLFKKEPKILLRYQRLFKYVLVDEYQDTNTAQYQLVKMLAQKHRNIFVVGDDWQSIYSWRGANYRNILNFNRDYPDAKIIKLEENYRSTQTILDAAGATIEANRNRSDKKLWTKKSGGEKITVKATLNERDEGTYIIQEILRERARDPRLSLNDFVVLYRTNAQSRALEESFLKNGIPYRIVGGVRFYERREVRDILAYLKVVANPDDTISLKRIINVPPRGIGDKTWQTIYEYGLTQLQPLGITFKDTPLPPRAQKALLELDRILTKAQAWKKSLSQLFDFLTKESGYLKWLDDRTIEGETRIENVKELKSVIEKYDHLEIALALMTFLEEVSLIQDTDEYNPEDAAVTLMTLHSAKGLEFEYVFIAGMEENLFPHSRSIFDQEELEEERRLCYVGITRARQKVYLTYAQERLLYGAINLSLPSRFIGDIPEELLERGRAETETGIEIEEVLEHPRTLRLKVGDKIEHAHFGKGEVVRTSRDELVVSFGRFGTKKLARNWAPIKKCGRGEDLLI
ncbi:hypothetical protein A2V68_00505 [candidate division Kazan bacterium RBG_13_50_9]|uniref:DNA 3'-5' helicase n=1 Tax=candidate division Kazan bacterium RBG_13_50_9 TaxID=1798535 RepID=A0A1F4NS91_UNCK3|nr:MAG: hypothetical protein A2V68_00505 [candidate division Kazan bacterium RBG_13_50_9]